MCITTPKIIPWDQIPLEWKQDYEMTAAAVAADFGLEPDPNSEKYRREAERIYARYLEEKPAFDAMLRATHGKG